MGTNKESREEKINPLFVALNTILCGQESGGTCVNPHINDAGEGLNRAETVAERLIKFLPNCVCL